MFFDVVDATGVLRHDYLGAIWYHSEMLDQLNFLRWNDDTSPLTLVYLSFLSVTNPTAFWPRHGVSNCSTFPGYGLRR